jgi:hypothetical protein
LTKFPRAPWIVIQRPWCWIAFGASVLLVALALRLDVLVRAGWLVEGDDALSALMAFAILDGDRPLMLKNQAYAGAWQPYAMALSYALFGASRVAARLPELAASMAFVGTTWLLAREVGGPVAARFAALLMAVPPVYILVLSLKPFAPYTEVAVLGSLALWCATVLVVGRDPSRDRVRALACGVAGGLAFWLHPLAVYYLVAIAVLCLLHLRGRRLVTVAGLGLAGFVVGALPIWVYNLQTNGATVWLLLAGARGEAANPLAVLSAWWNADVPRAVGLWDPWERQPLEIRVAMGELLVVALGWAVIGRPLWRRAPRAIDGTLLLLVAIPLVFVASGFGESALNPWGVDATGRYTLAIWGGLAVVLGAFLAAVWRWQRAAALALAGLALAANLYGCVIVDAVGAFQSPYWAKLPVDNGPLLANLRAQGISHVWLNHWAALPLMLDARVAGQPLLAYDWHDVAVGGIDRFPEYRAPMQRAERAAFVLVTDEEDPELLRRLRELGVAYRLSRVPPYLMVVPVSRVVHPAEVGAAIDERY